MVNLLIFIQISQNGSIYDTFIVGRNSCIRCSFQELPKDRPSTKTIHVDGIFMHYFIRELHYAPFYMQTFRKQNHGTSFLVQLTPVAKQIVDYNWNRRLDYLIRERCELEHTLSWLSTLGGAFSALGDYFINCAEIAGKISINQLKLALRLNDPSIVARCRLYLSLSLIQRTQFKLAKKIIYNEYITAKRNVVLDTRLINMCKGVWCKLQYERQLYYKKLYEAIYDPSSNPILT
ncbi:hypothetical protein RI129_012876 [Pyrocoelia pectoralis]|uniref:Uncharacterized protein n=1 Tax=Pyrocoelia pectoralis TaxID=417401 RepID=A0AAN7V4R6_9COLE